MWESLVHPQKSVFRTETTWWANKKAVKKAFQERRKENQKSVHIKDEQEIFKKGRSYILYVWAEVPGQEHSSPKSMFIRYINLLISQTEYKSYISSRSPWPSNT